MLALQDRKNVECCFLLVVVAFCFARQRRPRARKLYGGRSQEGKRIKIILVLKKKEEEQASHFLPFFFLSDGPLVVDDFSYLEGSAVWNAPFLLCVMLSSCSCWRIKRESIFRLRKIATGKDWERIIMFLFCCLNGTELRNQSMKGGHVNKVYVSHCWRPDLKATFRCCCL